MGYILSKISFCDWLDDIELVESKRQKMSDFIDLITNSIGLDKKNGVTTPILSINRQNATEKIKSLGSFSRLSSKRKEKIIKILDGEYGTVLDIVKVMAGYE